jgi:hypothetical protein
MPVAARRHKLGAKHFRSVARLQHTSDAALGTLLRAMTDREAAAATCTEIAPPTGVDQRLPQKNAVAR